MLKKLSVALCVASVFGVAVAQTSSPDATGVIKFKGTVRHEAPSIIVRQGTTPWGLDSGNAEIDLGANYATYLDNGGNGGWVESLAQPFEIVILRKAPAGTSVNQNTLFNHVENVTITMTSSTDVVGNVMKNDTSGGPTNVGVALKYFGYTSDGVLPSDRTGAYVFNGSKESVTDLMKEGGIQFTQHDPVFHFKAALQKIDSTKSVKAGNVSASVTVNMYYN